MIMMLRRLLLLLLLVFSAMPTHAACTAGACVTAGPRLASIDSQRASLLNAVAGSMTGSAFNLSAADWNGLAQSDVKLVSLVAALEQYTGATTLAEALDAPITPSQLAAALSAAAQAEGDAAAAAAYDRLRQELAAVPGTLRLSDLMTVAAPAESLSDTTVNGLDLFTGALQLQSSGSGAPTPTVVSGEAAGMGGVVNSITVQAQTVEPPRMVCGPAGTTFHSGAMRLKLEVDLMDAPLPVDGATASLGRMELYVIVGRSEGIITAVDAVSNAVTIQAAPGAGDVYLGRIADSVFFDPNRAIDPATDLDYSVIGSVDMNGTTADIEARSYARGEKPAGGTLYFTGPYPETQTIGSSSAAGSALAAGLVENLELRLNPSLGAMDDVLLPALQTAVSDTLGPLATQLLVDLVDPMLEPFGIRFGEMSVTVNGTSRSCGISGSVYDDADHSAQRDGGEAGTGVATWVKLLRNGSVEQVAAADPGTGAYSFAAVAPAAYTLVLGTENGSTDTVPRAPAGWIGTEAPDYLREVVMDAEETSGQNFGLYQGSRLAGSVFRDHGASAGIANNGRREDDEPGIAGVTVKALDTADAPLGQALTDANGGFVLWLPAATGEVTIMEINPADHVSTGADPGNTGGSYERTSDSLRFTSAAGTRYSGADFGDVKASQLLHSGQGHAAPGSAVFYPHEFMAGTRGEAVFAIAQAEPGWSGALYRDLDCSGALDSGDAVITGPLTVAANERVCLILKVYAPASATSGARNRSTLSATFAFDASDLSASHAQIDVTTLGEDGTLHLTKTVDKESASPGEVITYTIEYHNTGPQPLSRLTVRDSTPAYTRFASAACAALAPDLTACRIGQQPAVNTRGGIEWIFDGALAPDAKGTVIFSVTVE
jgi:uncharacterized repeat protein (TIGR01451 family)